MRPSWGFFGAAALVSCGSSAAKTNLIFHVDPPPSGDVACIGVAGFDVVVTAGGRSSPSGPLPNAAPVLDADSCHLTTPFTIDDIDPDSPASVTVTGHDGDSITRVQATGRVNNLRGGAAYLQLKTTATPPSPVLVVNRTQFLGGAPISDITRLTVSITGGGPPTTLVDVGPGAYSSVEPAPYGAPNLEAGGAAHGTAIAVDVATTTQGNLPRARRTIEWNPNGGYYEVK